MDVATCSKDFSRLYLARAGVFEGGYELDLIEGIPTFDLVCLGVIRDGSLVRGSFPLSFPASFFSGLFFSSDRCISPGHLSGNFNSSVDPIIFVFFSSKNLFFIAFHLMVFSQISWRFINLCCLLSNPEISIEDIELGEFTIDVWFLSVAWRGKSSVEAQKDIHKSGEWVMYILCYQTFN